MSDVIERFKNEFRDMPEEKKLEVVLELIKPNNINMKTNIKSPTHHAVWKVMSDYFKNIGWTKTAKTMEEFDQNIKELNVSVQGKRSTEIKEILTAYAKTLMDRERTIGERMTGQNK